MKKKMNRTETITEIIERLRNSDGGLEILKKFDVTMLAIIVDDAIQNDNEIRETILTRMKAVIDLIKIEI